MNHQNHTNFQSSASLNMGLGNHTHHSHTQFLSSFSFTFFKSSNYFGFTFASCSICYFPYFCPYSFYRYSISYSIKVKFIIIDFENLNQFIELDLLLSISLLQLL